MCKEYNGWSNYETWNAVLWIDNDEGSQSIAIEYAEQAESISDLSDQLKQCFTDDFMPENVREVLNSCSMFSDIFQAGLDNINWYEIAKNFWEDYHERSDEEMEEDNKEY